jgi:3'(2'), 5'-bisphosphate nucleotidase
MYFAAIGLGAYKKMTHHAAVAIQVSQNMVKPFRVVGSRSHSDETLNQWLEKLGECTLIPMGSSLKICLVAEGSADIYPRLGPTSLWDTAAAHAVLNIAGGAVFSMLGGYLNYANPVEVLNPHFIAIGNPSLNRFV